MRGGTYRSGANIPSHSPSAQSGTQIVQDYAEKRRQQLERAKQLREERERERRLKAGEDPAPASGAAPAVPTSQPTPMPAARAVPPRSLPEKSAHPMPGAAYQQYAPQMQQQQHQPQDDYRSQQLPYEQQQHRSGGAGVEYAHGSIPQPVPAYAPREGRRAPQPNTASGAGYIVTNADLQRAREEGILTGAQSVQLWDMLSRTAAPAHPRSPYADPATVSSGAVSQPQPAHRQTAAVQPAPARADPPRQQPVAHEAAPPRQPAPAPSSSAGGWNATTDVQYDSPEPDDVFLQRRDSQRRTGARRPAAGSSKPTSQAPRPEWNSNFDEQPIHAPKIYDDELPTAPPSGRRASGQRQTARAKPEWDATPTDGALDGGIGEPPPLPGRRGVAQKATRTSTTGASAARERESQRRQQEFESQQAPPRRAPPPADPPIATRQQVAPIEHDVDDVPAIGGGMTMADAEAEAAAAAAEPQEQCPECGRTFRVSVLERHLKVCGKTKKRKAFNCAKQRADALPDEFQRGAVRTAREVQKELAKAADPNAQKDEKCQPCIPKWKQQSEQFKAAMKMAHIASQVESGQLPASALREAQAAMPQPADDRTPCPHCGRKFAPDVAARHIPKCPKNPRRGR